MPCTIHVYLHRDRDNKSCIKADIQGYKCPTKLLRLNDNSLMSHVTCAIS